MFVEVVELGMPRTVAEVEDPILEVRVAHLVVYV